MSKLRILPSSFHSIEEISTHQGMAHFAGTGPIGMVCGDCKHYLRGRCGKYKIITRRTGEKFPPEAAACKYFTTEKYEIKSHRPQQDELFEKLPVSRKEK